MGESADDKPKKDRPWIFRTYAGHSTAEKSNALYRQNLGKGYGYCLIANIVVGIVGAFIAGWLLPRLGIVIGGGIIASIINALIGAIILLVIIGFFKR